MKPKSFHIPFSSKTTYEKFKRSAKVKGLILPVAISEAMELWIEKNRRKKSKTHETEDLKKLEKIKIEAVEALEEWAKMDETNFKEESK